MFRWLDDQIGGGKYELPHKLLKGYTYNGERIPLLDTGRGIRNPADFSSTLTIMTSAKRNGYRDEIRPDGLVRYAYQTKDKGDNVKLHRAFLDKVLLAYFHGLRDGFYTAFYPVYIVADDPVSRSVHLALDETFGSSTIR